MKITKNKFIRNLNRQIQLLQDYLPHATDYQKMKIEREIYNIQAQILQLNKTNKKFIKIKIEQFESSINL